MNETSTGEIRRVAFDQDCVPGAAAYDILFPPDAIENLPLLMFLHGGDGGEGFLAQVSPFLHACWSAGELPSCAVVTPACGQSYYLNYKTGREDWERLVTEVLPKHIAAGHKNVDITRVMLCGISMGGSGVLRMAFRHPDKYLAAAAMEPGVEEAFFFKDIPLRNRFWRIVPYEVAHGGPVDEDWWAANNIASLARNNAAAIKASGLKLYIEIGTDDCMRLHHGTEFLHRLLWDKGVKHEYRTVLDADHIGLSLPPRIHDALRFLGRALAPPADDPERDALRAMMADMAAKAGLADEV